MCWDRVIDAETRTAQLDDRRQPERVAPLRERVLPPVQEPIAAEAVTA